MSWLIPRMIAGVFMMLVGGAIGFAIGDSLKWPIVGTSLGAALGVGLVGLRDAMRGYRLISWLRGSQNGIAPRDAGFWGELGYRMERAIRNRELATVQEKTRLAQFLSAIEASPNGVLMLDAKDQIEWCNSVAADHFCLNPQRDVRQRITNLVRSPAFVAFLQSGDFNQPVVFPSPRGGGLLSVIARGYGEGQKLVLSQDITERDRADTMRRDFVANVSHEIRTPLTVLAGFIETLANLPLTEVERRRVLSVMTQQTQRMQTLVSDLLTLAQLEGSPRPASDKWVNAGALMMQAEEDARSISRGRHDLHFTAEPRVQIAGSEMELVSALGNLVNNAIRYTPEGGRIEVCMRLRPDGAAEFIVKDTGPGIEQEHLPRLTERFYRADGSRSRETGGTGLGLSIVKHVVQRHGGELDVSSELGKGSQFRIVFPAPRVRLSVPEVPQSPATETQAR